MKTIIVPTDFSDYSDRAVQAATKLAGKFGASIVLFHCLELPEKTNIADDEEFIEEIYNTRQNADLLLTKYTFPDDIIVRKVIRRGSVSEELNKFVETEKADLIIMGSHGVKGLKARFMGTNAQKTVRAVHIPVLVIKKGFSGSFENVVFASNFDEGEQDVFSKFVEFILPFNPTVHLLYIKDSDFWDMTYSLAQEVMQKFADIASPLTCETHIQRDVSSSGGVLKYIEKNSADLVAISNHERHPVKRIFMGSTVESLVNYAKIPVLSFDFNTETTETVS